MDRAFPHTMARDYGSGGYIGPEPGSGYGKPGLASIIAAKASQLCFKNSSRSAPCFDLLSFGALFRSPLAVYDELNWDFKSLEEAFEEGGILYGKKVFVFGTAEPDFLEDVNKTVYVPTVVVIESPFPPSEKLGIKAVQRVEEEIVPMKQMKMDWVPYIPFENRDRQVDRVNFQIFCLGCTQRRAALRHMKEDRVKIGRGNHL